VSGLSLPLSPNALCPGSDLLLNRLPSRICSFGDAGHDNLIKPIVNVACGHQIPHSRFQRFMTHPVLNGSHIEAGPEHTRCIGRAESLQIELP